MDIKLPSGKIIRGIPEGTPKEEIQAKAIQAGLATAEDFGMPEPAPAPEPVQSQQAIDTGGWGPSFSTRDRYMTPEATKSMGENIGALGTGAAQTVIDTGNLLGMPGRLIHENLRVLPGGQTLSTLMKQVVPELEEQEAIPRILPQGQDQSVDMLRTAAEWATPLPGGKVGKIDALIGGAAALGEQLYDDAGELIGGLGATLASLLRGKPKIDAPATEKAKEIILSEARKPDDLATVLRESLESGDTGTLAELTRDPGVFNIEAAAGKGTALQARLDELSQARIDQEAGRVSQQLGGELPVRPLEDVQQLAGERVGGLEQAIAAQQARNTARGVEGVEAQLPQAEQALVQAQIEANQAARVVDTPLKTAEASEQLSGVYAREQQALKELETAPAWKKFDEGEEVTAKQFQDDIDKWSKENLTGTEARMLSQKFGSTLKHIFDVDGIIRPKEIQSIVSEIKRINNNASKPGGEFTSANKFLGDIGRRLEQSLENLPGDAYAKAREATRVEKTRFEPSRVGKARGVDEARTFGERLMKGGSAGAEVGELILAAKSPEVTKAAETFFKSVAKTEGLNDAFMKNYDQLLDRFPELKGQLEKAKEAQDLLTPRREAVTELPETIKKQAEDITKAKETKAKGLSESVAKSQVGKLKANSETFLNKALTGSAEDLTKVNKQLSRVEGGQEALKLAVKDRVLGKIVKSTGGDLQIPAKSVEEFNSVKRNLIDSGILTKDEVIEIEGRLSNVAETGKLRKASAVKRAQEAQTIADDVIASGLSIAALNNLPNSTNQLMLAGVVKRSISKLIKNETSDKETMAALEAILKDPKKFFEDAIEQGAITEKRFSQYLNQVGKSIVQSVTEDEE